MSDITSPDDHGSGFFTKTLNPSRYDGHTDDPRESAGILRQFTPSNVRLLDVGCGTGSVLLIANRDKGNTVIGVEPDANRADVARSRGVNVHCGYLTEEFIRENGPFDAVMFADVLEHLPNPAGMIALASTGLKQGGTLLISVPNAVHWIMRWEMLMGRFDSMSSGIRDATHLRWFTRKTLVQLLDHSGFDVVDIRYSAGTTLPEYFLWRPWKWIPISNRKRLIRMGLWMFPNAFGCQNIVKARKR